MCVSFLEGALEGKYLKSERKANFPLSSMNHSAARPNKSLQQKPLK